MRLVHAYIGNRRKLVKLKRGKRYQVRWQVDPGFGPIRNRTRTTYRTIGEAEAFIDQLTWAGLHMNGWMFNKRGEPVRGGAPSETVIVAVCSYVKARWKIDWQEGQRSSVLGRLQTLVVHARRPRRP